MNKKKPTDLLGLRIKSLRKSKRLTQEELGAVCGINYKHLGAIERGDENPSLSILGKIAEGLGIEVIELFRFQHEEVDPTKLKKMIVSVVNNIRDEDVQKLQLVLKIINVLR
jgi:transcriptional regulator with XRE-family HTH domain